MAAVVALACLSIGARAAVATMTMRLDLAQIVSAADRAFVGHVTAVRSGRDVAGLPSTWVTFAVTEPIAGHVGSEVTIKQLGVSEPLSDGSVFRPAGVPAYKAGEEMVIFLSGDSDAGFCSPIGLAQGKFPIVRRDGRSVITTTAENAAALAPLRRSQAPGASPAVEADLDEFLSLVHRLLADKAKQ